MAYDELLLIEDVTSAQTLGSAYEGTGKDLSQGSYRNASPHWVRLVISAGAASGGDVTVNFTIQHSTASGSGYTDHSNAVTVVGASAVSPAILWIPVATDKRYIRVKAAKVSGTITTGLKWTAHLGNSQPQ